MMHEADRRHAGGGSTPAPLPAEGLVMRGSNGVSRVRCWPSQPFTAHLLMYQQNRPPALDDLQGWCDTLAERGFRVVRTSALAPSAAARVERAGFRVIQELALLQHDAPRRLPTPSVRGSRLLIAQHRDAAEVDLAAFGDGWNLDPEAITDTCRATPRHRARAIGSPLVAYAITGRDARQGFLQRLAVHPDQQRAGLGRALVLDSLRWAGRWRCERVLVNTPVDNDAALALYEATGFRRLRIGLAVYERSLV